MCLHNSKYPCGKCAECLQRWRNLWSIRLQEEANQCSSVLFGMITYDPKHIHYLVDKKTGEIFGTTLQDKELSNCIKRFRKNHGYIKFSYFVSGEYSEKDRAHYHPLFLVRDLKLSNDYLLRQSPVQWRAKLKYLRRFHNQVVKMSRFEWIDTAWLFADMFQREWNKGYVSLSYPKSSSSRCVHYATKYMMKKGVSPDHAQVPKLIMSKKIGLCYLTRDKFSQHLGTMMNDHGVGWLSYSYDRSDPVRVSIYPQRKIREVVSDPRYDYSDEGQYVLDFNFKTSFFHGTYGLPRYYREKIFSKFTDFEQDFIHYVNTLNFEREYWKRYRDFMREHGFKSWTSDCENEYREYIENVRIHKTNKMKEKYYG